MDHENYSKMIERTWSDPEFKKRLMEDPVAGLKEAGLEVPEGVEITVCEATPTHTFILLPPQPQTDQDLSEDDLEQVVGGFRRREPERKKGSISFGQFMWGVTLCTCVSS